MAEQWQEWRPPFAQHVLGEYTQREVDLETGRVEAQKWRVHCEQCGARFEGWCDSGQVRRHISKFATLHLHRDPFVSPKPAA